MSNRAYRQQIVDEYLQDSGAGTFVPADFLRWLKPKRSHRAWEVFFGKSESEAAHEYRLGLVRSYISGLRITIEVQPVVNRGIGNIPVARPRIVTVPAFVSPMAGRTEGGGYISMRQPGGMPELQRQAADDLARWLERYEGAVIAAGGNVAGIRALIARLDPEAGRDAAD